VRVGPARGQFRGDQMRRGIRSLGAGGAALALAAAVGVSVPAVSAHSRHHEKTKIEYRTPKACATALADARQVIGQLAAGFTDTGHYFESTLGAAALAADINTITKEVASETKPFQAAEYACDGY
jgi:hypothetical protein